MAPRCSIVVPTVESVHSAFERCIPSLLEHEGRAHEIIVVDDGSAPTQRDRAERRSAELGLRFLHNERNRGYPATVNRGIDAATGEVVVLVNSDIVFTRPVTPSIRRALAERPRVGIVGGLLFYPDGSVQHGGIAHRKGYFYHRGHHGDFGEVRELHRAQCVLGCTGALVALRRQMIDEIGRLDESLTQACDDIEYGLRAWKAGWQVLFLPEVQAIHLEGGTRGNTFPSKLRRSLRWTVRELRTYRRFRAMLARADVDVAEIERRVAAANAAAGNA